MPVVAASGIVKTYGTGRAARRVLDGADLEVQAGEVVAVLGLLRAGAGEGRAIVLVTHEPAAAEIADRVLTLREGRLC